MASAKAFPLNPMSAATLSPAGRSPLSPGQRVALSPVALRRAPRLPLNSPELVATLRDVFPDHKLSPGYAAFCRSRPSREQSPRAAAASSPGNALRRTPPSRETLCRSADLSQLVAARNGLKSVDSSAGSAMMLAMEIMQLASPSFVSPSSKRSTPSPSRSFHRRSPLARNCNALPHGSPGSAATAPATAARSPSGGEAWAIRSSRRLWKSRTELLPQQPLMFSRRKNGKDATVDLQTLTLAAHKGSPDARTSVTSSDCGSTPPGSEAGSSCNGS